MSAKVNAPPRTHVRKPELRQRKRQNAVDQECVCLNFWHPLFGIILESIIECGQNGKIEIAALINISCVKITAKQNYTQLNCDAINNYLKTAHFYHTDQNRFSDNIHQKI